MDARTVHIDGSHGEGGGQVIRTSLAMSIVTGRAVELRNVRANRSTGGLRPQHLMSVQAAARISSAAVDGAEVGSTAFAFDPGRVTPGEYIFDIGTAGSTTLVLQTVLLPLLLADGPSRLEIIGGTLNTHAPPAEFISETFLPLVRRMGGRVDLELVRYGTYPRGGGRIDVSIQPATDIVALHLVDDVSSRVSRARALVLNLPRAVGERELAVLAKELGLDEHQLELVESGKVLGAGNAVLVTIDAGDVVELVSAIGERRMKAEAVAAAAAAETTAFLTHRVPVGEHLADQLLLPMLLLGGGSYRTATPSLHATTNVDTIDRFVDSGITFTPQPDASTLVTVPARRLSDPRAAT